MEKVNYVRKYIEVKFPTIGAEFHDQIRSITPIILTLPCMGVVGLTIDRETIFMCNMLTRFRYNFLTATLKQ